MSCTRIRRTPIPAIRPTIYIQVSNGTVTLDGSVLDNSIKQQAQGLAQSVTGVQNVRNSLDIVPVGSYPAFGYVPASMYGTPQTGYE